MAPTTHVALLRGINVGGRNAIAMADLRAFLQDLGLENPRTLLQSGNALFGSRASPGRLEERLEAEAAKRLSLQVDFIVRSATEWSQVITDNPFRKEATADPSHLLLMCLKTAPSTASVEALQAAVSGRELIRAAGRQLYLVYPDGIGRSRLTGALIEKTLRTRGTARNWNTVLKLAALAERESPP